MTKPKKPPDMSWETYAEQQIREAQEAGKFDNLPGFGRPIPGIDFPPDEDWWLKQKTRDENLSLLPPALEIRRDVDRTLQSVWQLSSETEVRQILEALNERIRKATFAITWGPSSTTMPVDVEELVREWHARKASGHRGEGDSGNRG